MNSEAAVLQVVREYLVFHGFNAAAEALPTNVNLNMSAEDGTPQNSMFPLYNVLQAYDKGDELAFFTAWNQCIPTDMLRKEPQYRKCDFFAHVYMFLYPLFQDPCLPLEELQDRSRSLQRFLEDFHARYRRSSNGSRGHESIRREELKEYQTYRGLPFISRPDQNKLFAPLFSMTWRANLRNEIIDCIIHVEPNSKAPQLYRWYDLFLCKSSSPRESSDTLGHHSRRVSLLSSLKQQLIELEQRIVAFRQHYSVLYNTATNLLKALQGLLQGRLLNSEYVTAVQRRLDRMEISHLDTVATIPDFECKLDYQRIRENLLISQDNKLAQVALLQALRQRILSEESNVVRNNVVCSYTVGDIFGFCSSKSSGSASSGFIFELLADSVIRSTPPDGLACVILEYFFRLLDVICSFSCGRLYVLSSTSDFVENLIGYILKCSSERKASVLSTTWIFGLSVLRKLSYHRPIRDVLIERGILGWACTLMRLMDSWQPFTIECFAHLLANLISKELDSDRLQESVGCISHLARLLQHDAAPQIRSDILKLFHVLLHQPFIRTQAASGGLHELLRNVFLGDDSEKKFLQHLCDLLEKQPTDEATSCESCDVGCLELPSSSGQDMAITNEAYTVEENAAVVEELKKQGLPTGETLLALMYSL